MDAGLRLLAGLTVLNCIFIATAATGRSGNMPSFNQLVLDFLARA
jgi:hypothetical protein